LLTLNLLDLMPSNQSHRARAQTTMWDSACLTCVKLYSPLLSLPQVITRRTQLRIIRSRKALAQKLSRIDLAQPQQLLLSTTPCTTQCLCRQPILFTPTWIFSYQVTRTMKSRTQHLRDQMILSPSSLPKLRLLLLRQLKLTGPLDFRLPLIAVELNRHSSQVQSSQAPPGTSMVDTLLLPHALTGRPQRMPVFLHNVKLSPPSCQFRLFLPCGPHPKN
jgi:hypothetical protein